MDTLANDPPHTPLALFRKEASGETGSFIGEVLIAAPPARWLYVAMAAVAAVSLFGILFFGTYTAHERVSGVLVPSGGIETATARMAGVVLEVKVKAGDHVRKGDPLAILSGETTTSVDVGAQQAIGTQLHAQLDDLQGRLGNQARIANANNVARAAKMTSLRASGAELERQIAQSSHQIAEATALQARMEPVIRKGIVSGVQAQQQRDSIFSLRSAHSQLLRQRIDIRQQLADLEAENDQADTVLSTTTSLTQQQIHELRQRMAENDMARENVLLAQSSGVVSSVMADPGQAVRVGQAIVSLLPDGAAVHARLLATGRAIAMARTGTVVIVRYRAFPYQQYGEQKGTVAEISLGALLPAELAALTGRDASSFDEPLYKVTVALDAPAEGAALHHVRVLPGMLVDADLLLGRHRLIEWVLDPLRRETHLPGAHHG